MIRLTFLFFLSLTTPTFAQWQVPTNAIPYGKGRGAIGFGGATNTGTGFLCLLDTLPPSFRACPGTGGSGTVTSIVAGTGLGGGTITATGTLSVLYGTSAGTAAQGNDSRILGALQAASNLADLANAGTARANLGLLSMATQPASSVAITGGSITGLGAPTASSDAATKGYVDSVAVGLSVKQAVKYATVAALAANTYANGASGVGATLTANANGAATIDGTSPTVGDRSLIKDEVTASHNGCYTWTAVGDGSNPYILTRCTDLDTSAELLAGSALLVTAGATLINTGWVLTATVTTVGTTSAIFAQYAAGSSNQWTTSGTDILNNNAGTVKIGNLTTTGLTGILLGNGASPVTALASSGTGNVARVASPAFTGIVTYNGTALAPSATTDTTSATNITSGTLPDARLSNVITAGGPIGDSTHVPIITYDAHGRLTTVSTATISGSVSSQWTSLASDIYFSGGKVTIGSATAPGFDLDIQRSSAIYLGSRVYNTNSGPAAFSGLVLGNDTNQFLGQVFLNSSGNIAYGGANSLNLMNTGSWPVTLGTNNTVGLLVNSASGIQLPSYGAGTIGAGASGNLKSSKAYYGAAYGMICDGSTANDTAWSALTAAYAASPGPIILPPGKCNFSSSISLTVSGTDGTGASITGAGANSSVLVFTGATSGLGINYTASVGWNYGTLTLQDFGVQTKQTDAGNGITINGGSTTGVPSAPVYIKNVHAYADVSPHRWVIGLALNNTHRVIVDAFTYDGDNSSFDHGIGISINGTGQEIVEIMMSNVDINYAANGIAVTGHVQGVFCTSCNLTATTIGVAWNTDIIEPQFQFSGQIAATNYCMYLNNLSAASIHGLLCVPTGSPNQVAIYASNVVESQFSNITIESSAANVNGFVFASGSLNNIVSNVRINGSGSGCGVWFQSGANNNTYSNINVLGGLSCTLLDQGSGNAGYSPSTAGAFATSLFSNALASNFGYVTRSGTGGGFGTNTFNIWWTGAAAHLYIDNTDIGSFNITSDIRFKNVLPEKPTSVLDKIASLDFFRYRYRDLGIMKDDGIERDGFSASQLQRLFPSAVNGTPDGFDANGAPIPQTINQPELLPVMLKAIQELKGANDNLRTDVLLLKRQNTRQQRSKGVK